MKEIRPEALNNKYILSEPVSLKAVMAAGRQGAKGNFCASHRGKEGHG